MKLPLNLAIIKHFTTTDEACAEDVMVALEKNYANYRMFNRQAIYETLFTAEINGFIQETRYELVDNDLRVYYHANADAQATINKYIPN